MTVSLASTACTILNRHLVRGAALTTALLLAGVTGATTIFAAEPARPAAAVRPLADPPTFTEPHEIGFTTAGKPAVQSAWRQAEFRGLTIRMLPGETRSLGKNRADNAFLRPHEQAALEYIGRDMQIGIQPADRDRLPLPVCEMLAGYPAIITGNDLFWPSVIRLDLSKPGRVYAWIDAENEAVRSPRSDAERWRRFHVDPLARHALFYRDFDAGQQEIHLGPGSFCGAGICPLDGLSPAERIVAVADVTASGPVLEITSSHATPQDLQLTWAWRDPAAASAPPPQTRTVTVTAGNTSIPVPFEAGEPGTPPAEGTVRWLEATLVGSGGQWRITLPSGAFPVPPADASVEEPVLPYGAYLKLECNDDPRVLGTLLRATFHHLRCLHMNTVIPQTTDPPRWLLDLAHEYRLRTIVRLHRVGGEKQEKMMRHPAVLTYMAGDEPKVGPKLDHHIAMFTELTAKYPQFKPVTCTIFDDWGTGSDADPDRIYNDHLQRFDMVRMGRLYSMQKLDYGVGKPISYKPRQETTSIMLGLEAETRRDWWLAPPFFGQSGFAPAAAQYWRTPTGVEMTTFMHLAFAHRCRGILGWGTHSHQGGLVRGLLFDGRTMRIEDPATYAAMRDFGQQFDRAQPTLRAFTPALIPVHRTRPFALDAQARWLKTRQMAVYVVNRDLEHEAAADLLVLIADRLVAKYQKEEVQPDAFVAEIAGVKDALTGRSTAWKTETQENRFEYLRITDTLAPGEARLYVVSAKGEGRFSGAAVPAGPRAQFFDQDFAPID